MESFKKKTDERQGLLTQRVRVSVGAYLYELDRLMETARTGPHGVHVLHIPRALRVQMPNFEYSWMEALLLDRRDTFVIRESGPEELLELFPQTRERPILAAECAIHARNLGGEGMDVAWPEPTPPFIAVWAALYWRYGVAAGDVEKRDSAVLMLLQYNPQLPPTTLEWAEELAVVVRRIAEKTDTVLRPRVMRWLQYMPTQ